jgi:hypothetical protein
MSVIEDMLATNADKTKSGTKLLKELSELMPKKAEDYGPICEVLDIIFAATGYQDAPVPGGEQHICGRTLAKIVRYMTLRAKELKTGGSPNWEPLSDTMVDLTAHTVLLHNEYLANRVKK